MQAFKAQQPEVGARVVESKDSKGSEQKEGEGVGAEVDEGLSL